MVTGIASQATPQWRQQGSTWRPTASSSMSLPTRPCHFPASPSHSRFSGGLGPGPHVTPATLPPSPQESQPQGPVDAQDQSTRGAKLLPERRSASRRPPSRTVPCARPGLRAGRTSAPHPTSARRDGLLGGRGEERTWRDGERMEEEMGKRWARWWGEGRRRQAGIELPTD